MKILNLPIIGLPNVGKSSLLNALIGQKVSIVTNKPHTTRTMNVMKKKLENCEMIFVDTPGIKTANSKLAKVIFKNMQSYLKSLDDMILVLDCTNLNLDVFLPYIENSIVVINKIDYLRKPKLLPIINEIKNLNPKEIFCVCAKTGDGVEDIIEFLQKEDSFVEVDLDPESDDFDESEILEYACECVREKILIKFEEEIPYNIIIKVVDYAIFKESAWKIFLDIIVPKQSYKPIIIGNKAENLKEIGRLARLEIATKLKQPGYLGLNIKIDQNLWKKEETYTNLGWKL